MTYGELLKKHHNRAQIRNISYEGDRCLVDFYGEYIILNIRYLGDVEGWSTPFRLSEEGINAVATTELKKGWIEYTFFKNPLVLPDGEVWRE